MWLHSLEPKALYGKITRYPYLTGISIFLLGFFEGDVTTHYAGWWKQSILYHHRDFAKNILGERAVYAMMLVFPPEFCPLKTILFGNPSQDTVDPRDGGFGGRLSRWKWEK